MGSENGIAVVGDLGLRFPITGVPSPQSAAIEDLAATCRELMSDSDIGIVVLIPATSVVCQSVYAMG